MKEVGDKFGAGELILPFVLQSAEVMKRAVAQLENYLDKHRGLHQGHGRHRDRVRRRARHRQVAGQHDPHQQRLHGRRPRQAGPDRRRSSRRPRSTTRRRSASARCSSRPPSRCRCASRSSTSEGLEFPVLIGGAAINRDFGLRALYPERHASPTRSTSRASSTARTPSRAWPRWTSSSTSDARAALVAKTREAAKKLREKGPEPEHGPTRPTTRCAPPRAPTRPIPEPPFWGVREIEVDLDEVYPHLDTHVLFKLHWGGRGVKGEAWRKLVDEDFRPRLERMWREQDYLHPRAQLGYFPCYSEGNEVVVLDPEDRETRARAPRLPAPAQARPHLPGRLLPPEGQRRARRRRAAGGHRRRRGHRADGAAWRPTASSPSSSSSTASACRRPRAWPSGCTRSARRDLGIDRRPGPALLVGLPRLPGPVRAREGLPPARRAVDRPAPVAAATPSSPSSRRSRSSPTTRRPSTSA